MDERRYTKAWSDMYSSNEQEVKFAITALAREVMQRRDTRAMTGLIRLLRYHVAHGSESIALAAITGLRQLPGDDAVQAIAVGLKAYTSRIRSWAAHTLGDMAHTGGRRVEVMGVVDRVVTCVRECQGDPHFVATVAHALCKIGGPAAANQLLEIIENEASPAMSRAMALYGPLPEGSAPDFVERALGVIAGWSPSAARDVAAAAPFQYLPARIQARVLSAAGGGQSSRGPLSRTC